MPIYSEVDPTCFNGTFCQVCIGLQPSVGPPASPYLSPFYFSKTKGVNSFLAPFLLLTHSHLHLSPFPTLKILRSLSSILAHPLMRSPRLNHIYSFHCKDVMPWTLASQTLNAGAFSEALHWLIFWFPISWWPSVGKEIKAVLERWTREMSFGFCFIMNKMRLVPPVSTVHWGVH